jgi:hypothetical protein
MYFIVTTGIRAANDCIAMKELAEQRHTAT